MKPGKRILAWSILTAALAATAALAYVRQPSAGPRRLQASGQLLVANRGMADPNFAGSVIYVVEHARAGAMGLVVNRVYGAVGLGNLLEALGIPSNEPREVPLHYGGPVDRGLGFVMHSTDYTGPSSRLLDKDLALSGVDVAKAIAEGRGPKRALFLFGYAGWGPGQLDQELARGDWLLAPADPALIFSPDPASVWQNALRRAGMAL